MMRWLLVFLILALCGTALYFFIPSQMQLGTSIGIKVSAKGFSRTFPDDKMWKQWWPGKVKEINANTLYEFNNRVYTIAEKNPSSLLVNINITNTLRSELLFIPENPDSIVLSWVSKLYLPNNPVTRVQLYFKSLQLKKDLETIAHRIKSFYEKDENIYGLKIIKDHVRDSTLISTSASSKGFPTIEHIYALIEKLQMFALQKGAKQTGLPMLNIHTSDSINFVTRVALPVNKKLKDEGDVVYRWMLGGGNILVTEVIGGPFNITKAFKELENYVIDNRRVSPAIPFQSLVTDRRKETDTSKWITRIYWPVM